MSMMPDPDDFHGAAEVMPLSRLLYTSCSTLEGDAAVNLAREIAAAASIRNRKENVTGCLLLTEGTFVQILEGTPEQVERVFDAICCDRRHHDLRLLDLVSAYGRVFPEWGMGCLTEKGQAQLEMADRLQEIRYMAGFNAAEAVQKMRALLNETSA